MSGGLYLVCGSRNWPAPWFVTAKMIELIPRGAMVLTGGARGVDTWAHEEAVRLGYQTRVIAADWEAEGGRADISRTLATLGEHPAVVLAFQYAQSRGTGHAARVALHRGVKLYHFTEKDLPPAYPG